MQISGSNIQFRTNRKFFQKGKDGRKPNTTQTIPSDKFDYFQGAFKGLKTITIVDNETGEPFTRTLTDISEDYVNVKVGGSGNVVVDVFVFSWGANRE